MPLINPLLLAQLRRHWQLSVAVLVFALFALAHVLLFQPAAQRYRTALKRAGDLGLALDPDRPPPVMPPRVLALLTDNALPASTGMSQESGALTADLLEQLSQLTTRHGLQVLATEPGATIQEAHAVQVRAHLKIRCSFSEFVAFLDDLSRANRLIAVDRFDLVNAGPGEPLLDLWVTRYVLKQSEGRRRS